MASETTQSIEVPDSVYEELGDLEKDIALADYDIR